MGQERLKSFGNTPKMMNLQFYFQNECEQYQSYLLPNRWASLESDTRQAFGINTGGGGWKLGDDSCGGVAESTLSTHHHLSHPYCYKYQLCGKRKPFNQKKDDSHNILSSRIKRGTFLAAKRGYNELVIFGWECSRMTIPRPS